MMDSRSLIDSYQSYSLNERFLIAFFEGNLVGAKRYLVDGADINGTFRLVPGSFLGSLRYIDLALQHGDSALSIALRQDSSEKVAFLLDNHVAPSSVLDVLLEEPDFGYSFGYSFGYAVASLLCTAVTKQDLSVAQLQPVVQFVKRAEVRLRKEPSNTNSLYADFVFSLHCHYAKSADSDLMYYLAKHFFWGGENSPHGASLTKKDLKIVKNRLFELISGVKDIDLQRKLCAAALDDTQSNLLSAILYIKTGAFACNKSSGTLGEISKLLVPKRVLSSAMLLAMAAGPRREPQVKPPAQDEKPASIDNNKKQGTDFFKVAGYRRMPQVKPPAQVEKPASIDNNNEKQVTEQPPKQTVERGSFGPLTAFHPSVQLENPTANNNGYDDNLYSLNK
jgi:hypothetical protein